MAGPTIEAIWKLSWLSAIAEGNRSGGHEPRIDDERAGWSTAREPRREERDDEQRRDRRIAAQGEEDQGQAAGRQPDLCRHQQPPPVHRVGQRAGPEREQQDRDQLEQGQRGDGQGRAGQHVDLVRQRDPGDLVADAVDDLAGPQPAVVAVAPERRGVEEDAANATARRPATAPSGWLVRRPRTRTGRVWPWVAKTRVVGQQAGHHLKICGLSAFAPPLVDDGRALGHDTDEDERPPPGRSVCPGRPDRPSG